MHYRRTQGRGIALVLSVSVAAMLHCTQAVAQTPQEAAPATEQNDVQYQVRAVLEEVAKTHEGFVELGTAELFLGTRLANHMDQLWLGVDVTPADAVLRAQLGLPADQGLIVTAIHDGSPAAEAGVQKHDVMLTLAGKALPSEDELRAQIQAVGENATPLLLIRAGKKLTIDVTPKMRTLSVWLSSANALNAIAGEPRYRIGVELAKTDDTLRAHLSLPADRGLVVTKVNPDAPAAKAGIQPHDILLTVADKAVGEVGDVAARLQETAEKPVAIKLVRAGKPIIIEVTPEKRVDDLGVWRHAITLTESSPVTATFEVMRSPFILTDESLSNVVLPQPEAAAPPPSLEKQLSDISEQLKQLQKAVETLATSLHKGEGPTPEKN